MSRSGQLNAVELNDMQLNGSVAVSNTIVYEGWASSSFFDPWFVSASQLQVLQGDHNLYVRPVANEIKVYK